MKFSHPILFSAAIGGVVGLLVALVLAFIVPRGSLSDAQLFVLWPTAIFGIAWNEPPRFTPLTVVMLTVLYGGNALIYALAASVPVGTVLGMRDFIDKNSRIPPSIKPR